MLFAACRCASVGLLVFVTLILNMAAGFIFLNGNLLALLLGLTGRLAARALPIWCGFARTLSLFACHGLAFFKVSKTHHEGRVSLCCQTKSRVLDAFETQVQGAGVKTCFKAPVGALKRFQKALRTKAGMSSFQFFGEMVI
jgi:outer membrane PBP1 activator LpoA protein